MVTPAGRWIALTGALLLQVAAHLAAPAPQSRPQDLGQAPGFASLQLASLGDRAALADGIVLGLQSFDLQGGTSIPWRLLDYNNLADWMAQVLALHPDSQYILLCASRLYAEVPDPARTRRMLRLVADAFLADPDHRWPWLAHGVVLARHRLHDNALALQYAHLLRTHIRDPAVPHWVGQMEALALADLHETEAARVLLGGLLASGSIRDDHERHFLVERLQLLGQEAPIVPTVENPTPTTSTRHP